MVSTVEGDAVGATWGLDGTIVFATADRTTRLQRVSAEGGTPTVLTRPSFGAERVVVAAFDGSKAGVIQEAIEREDSSLPVALVLRRAGRPMVLTALA